MPEVFEFDPVAESKARRAGHRENSPAMLRGAGIAFVPKNNGAHLIVRHNDKVADFWPGTGKFGIRGEVDAEGNQRYHRGVRLLIKRLREFPTYIPEQAARIHAAVEARAATIRELE